MKKRQTNDKPVVSKGLLIMKLSLLLIVLGVLQSTASVYAQNWRFSLDENFIVLKPAEKEANLLTDFQQPYIRN